MTWKKQKQLQLQQQKKKTGGDDEDVADEDVEDEIEDDEDEGEAPAESKVSKLEEEYNTKIENTKKKIAELKISIMRSKEDIKNVEKKMVDDKKEMEFFRKEYEKLPPKDQRKPKKPKKAMEKAPQTEEEMIAKFKRDLRVYKYTLDLTRKEWKKNQTLALEKMNAHRKVIAKYKDDKIMLLNIVSELEAKLNEANRRLREGQEQQKKANQLLGYDFTKHAAPSDCVPVPKGLHQNKLDDKKNDALKAFMK